MTRDPIHTDTKPSTMTTTKMQMTRASSSFSSSSSHHHHHYPPPSHERTLSSFRSLNTIILLVVCWIACCFDVTSASFMITLSRGSHECFVLRARAQDSLISGNYECLHDDAMMPGILRAELWLENGDNATQQDVVWHSHEPEDVFTLDTRPSGKYWFCIYYNSLEEQQHFRDHPDHEHHRDIDGNPLRNGDGVEEVLDVGFNVWMEPPLRTLSDEERGPDALRALAMVQEAAALEVYCRNLLDHFDYLRQRERVHHLMANVLLKRVMQWTIIEAILMVLIALAQVWYFTKFFEQTRYL